MLKHQTLYADEEEAGLIVSSGNHQKLHDDVQLVAALTACSNQKDLCEGRRLHVEVLKRGLFRENIIVGNALASLYAKDNALAKAKQVFDELPVRDVVSWNVLISAYCRHGHDEEAIGCLEQLQGEGLSPNAVTFLCIVKACGNLGAVQRSKEIHSEIARLNSLGRHDVLGNALVDMYAKCGALGKAQEVFDGLLIRDVVSWTALITGYADIGLGQKAISCFERMKCEGLSPDSVSFACILKACGSIDATQKGKETHAEILQGGLLTKVNRMIGNALVEMYAKSGALALAQRAFNALAVRDVISWTALIAGYCQHGHDEEAMCCFHQMKREGICPDVVTFVCILKACGGVGVGEKRKQAHANEGSCTDAARKGRQIHAEVIRAGLMDKVSLLGSAIIDMYVKCGVFAKAREVMADLQIRDVVSWTALIAGYVQHGHGEEAFDCFRRMQCDGFAPNAATFACILKACGILGAAEKGRDVHTEIARKGLLGKDAEVNNALVDMYAKCGALAKAQEVFDKLTTRNVVSWNTLIAGYCQHGHGTKALYGFEQMKAERVSPDAVTLTCVLKACGSTAGHGPTHFEAMCSSYGILPTLKHHTFMLDLFCRAGHFDKAMAMLTRIPFADHNPIWFTLLGACRKRGNIKLARLAFEHVV